MNQTALDKDMIPQPELWKLALNITSDRMDVGLYPPLTREEMMWRTFPFDPATASPLRAIEDIIYDNPLLFSDFKRVDCIIDNVPAIPVPAEADEEEAMRLYSLSTACETDSSDRVELFTTGTVNSRIALVQNRDIRAFLTRTFYNARFDSSLAALCRYFAGRPDAPLAPAVYAPVCGNRMTLIAIDGRRLLTANEFRFEKPIDAIYYIIASMSRLGLDIRTTDAFVSGASDPESEFGTLLRRFLPQAAPIPFPTLRYRATKSTLLAPLPLTIRPLCE